MTPEHFLNLSPGLKLSFELQGKYLFKLFVPVIKNGSSAQRRDDSGRKFSG
jgi:hypothetical protein